MEKPKVAFTRALDFFVAAAMARLPEEMKRAKINVTATQICHSLSSLAHSTRATRIPPYTRNHSPITIWTMPSPIALLEESLAILLRLL